MRRLKGEAEGQSGARTQCVKSSAVPGDEQIPTPLAEREQRDLILRATRSALLEFDPQARITAVYGAFHELTGYSDLDVLGRNLREIFPGRGWPGVAIRPGQGLVINGRHLNVHVQGTPGPVTGCAGRLCLTATQTPHDTRSARGGTARTGGSLNKLVGPSAALHHLKELAVRIAKSDLPVLLTGESGTGKELFARAIHEHSERRDAPFVPINCAAVPESLLESELFGYEAGAFTGADRKGRIGLFEQARGGTLLLDEIGDLPLARQAAFLRALEEGCSRRVGGLNAIPIDVRIIAATNRPLEDLVDQGRFRLDLFHRLCALPLRLSALRERSEDIPSLVGHFMESMGHARYVPPDVMDCLMRYRWPGNVRELRHCIEYMCTVSLGAFTVDDLPPPIQSALESAPGAEGPNVDEAPAAARIHPDSVGTNGRMDLDDFILEAIAESNAAGHGLGRLALAERARSQGIDATENKIRARMHALRDIGALEWHRGRGGARLTAKGQRLLGSGAQ